MASSSLVFFSITSNLPLIPSSVIFMSDTVVFSSRTFIRVLFNFLCLYNFRFYFLSAGICDFTEFLFITVWQFDIKENKLKKLFSFFSLKRLSPCFFNLYAGYIIRNTGLDEAQAGIKIAGRNTNNLRYADDATLMAESEKELKNLLMKVKEESEKVGLKQHSEN